MKVIRQTDNKDTICRQVLEALPHWFGIAESVDQYVADASKQLMFVAQDQSQLVGMITLQQHNSLNIEIAAMGVMPDHHRNGIGRQLVAAAEQFARQAGAKAMTVKTLSSRASDEGYAKTRAFYEGVGFQVFEEMPSLWDNDNPAVVLIKFL